MNQFERDVVQRLTRIETLLSEKPCIKHDDAIENINKKFWFVSGALTCFTTILTLVINLIFPK